MHHIQSSRESMFQLPEMQRAYQLFYPAYKPDPATLSQLKVLDYNFHIVVVLGTWCSDSQRYLPRFFKIMDAMQINEDRIKLIFVNEQKQSPEGLIEGLHVINVPTFIFMRDHSEIGRIVESPRTTLEEDLLQILTKNHI